MPDTPNIAASPDTDAQAGHEDALRLAQIVEASPSGMLKIDAAGRIILVNRHIEKMFGYGRAELIGRQVEMLLPERFRGAHVGLRGQFAHSASTREMGAGREIVGLRRDGSEFPVEIGLNPMDWDGEVHVLAAVQDITLRRTDELERERRRHELERVIEASPSGLLKIDAAGRIMLVNQHIEVMFGYDRAELLGRKVEMLLPARFRGAHAGLRTDFATGASAREMGAGRDIVGLRRDGSEFPVEIGLNPLPIDGEIHVLAAVQDISRRHAEALENERRRQELERSNADLAEFAHAASHDLKAPLRGMAHLAEWIAEDIAPTASPQTLENLAILRSRAARMQALLTGLLAYARVGRENIAPEAVDTGAMVREVVATLALPAGFTVEMPLPMPVITTARLLLEGVLQNLIENAVKHHDREEGRITITAAREDGMTRFTVADDGPGILPRFHKRIFQIFQTLASRDDLEASGLGLAIVKRKVELRGGSIGVESTPPMRGARFIFTWPDLTAP